MIAKQDAVMLLTLADEDKIKTLEACIDEAIRTKYGNGVISVDVPGYSDRVCNHVMSKYRVGGWKVQLIDDQRDGRFIMLS